jgi:hypothetical protein
MSRDVRPWPSDNGLKPPAVGIGNGTVREGSQCLVLAAGVDKAEHRRALLVGGL